MDRMYALLLAGTAGRINVVLELRRQIRGKSIADLRKSAFDVVGPHGEVLVAGFNHVEPVELWKQVD